MKIGFGPNQQLIVTRYEPGDLVALRADQGGEFGAGRAGDWGQVKSVDQGGRLTIQLAGFSMPRAATLAALSDVPARLVRPCDAKGRPVELKQAGARMSEALWQGGWESRQ